jgi:hypothetical protein
MNDSYSAKRRHLIDEMQAEIIDTDQKILEYKKTHGAGKYAHVLIFVAFIMNVIFFIELPNYSLFWVVSSFLLLMFNPIILMLPTEKADLAFPSGKGEEMGSFTGLLRDAAASAGTAVMRERKLYAESLWNLFFINCQPIAPGFILLFSISIILAVVGLVTGFFELRSAVILLVQSLAIIGFYLGIMKIKPYSPGFFLRSYGNPHRHLTPHESGNCKRDEIHPCPGLPRSHLRSADTGCHAPSWADTLQCNEN